MQAHEIIKVIGSIIFAVVVHTKTLDLGVIAIKVIRIIKMLEMANK